MRLNLSISKRLIASFSVMGLMVLIAIAVGVWYTAQVGQTVGAASVGVKQVDQMADLQFVWSEVAATVDNMLLTRQVSVVEGQLLGQLDEFDQDLAALDAQPPGLTPEAVAANQKIIQEMNWLGRNLTKVTNDIIDLAREGNWPQAQALRYSEMVSFQHRFDTELNKLNANVQNEFNQLPGQVTQVQRISLAYWIIIGLLTIVIAIISGGLAIRSITRPVNALTAQAERVTRRDFSPVTPLAQKDEIGELSRTFALMTDWLRDSYESLEQRVHERTQRLETIATLSERLNAILNVSVLLQETVNLIQSDFGYYHTHIYLLNDEKNTLTVAAGTGKAGAEMKAKKHAIALNASSLVARAARTARLVRVDDVHEVEDWLPNPLLPYTRSEMAAPIIIEGQVEGVLDVQEDRVAALDEGDANVLRSLASQVAIAIRNARLFERVEAALAEAYEAQERYTRQAWQKEKMVTRRSKYLYVKPEAKLNPAEIAPGPVADKLQVTSANGGAQMLTAPIRLRDQTIGKLQLGAPGPEASWTDEQLSILEIIVDQFAQSAENIRLFDETRERAGREQVIREITDKLRAAPNLNALLKTAARELGLRLGARHTVLEMGIEKNANEPDVYEPTGVKING